MKILISLLFLFPFFAHAAPYNVDYSQSKVTFSGTHAGDAFNGVFGAFEAVIDFNQAALDTSKVMIGFDMASAKTGNDMYDGTLPTKDWFDIASHPKAMFVGESFSKHDGGSFKAEGTLTIRDITHPISFDFTLEPQGEATKMTTEFSIDRMQYTIGTSSDPDAEWVSQMIDVQIILIAEATAP